MKEAKVKCICAEIRLPDLGVKLREGQEIWLSEERVRLSQDLKLARRIGAVDLAWKERARVTKPPAPPHFRRLTPGQHRKPSVDPKPQPAPVIVNTIDPDLIAKHVKAALAGEVSKIRSDMNAQVDAMRGDLAAQLAAALAAQGQQVDPEVLAATLAATIKETMASMPQAAPVVVQAPGAIPKSEDPLYIPSGIVEAETKGKVDVQESTSDEGGLDSAAAALKALKKRKQKTNE